MSLNNRVCLVQTDINNKEYVRKHTVLYEGIVRREQKDDRYDG